MEYKWRKDVELMEKGWSKDGERMEKGCKKPVCEQLIVDYKTY